MLTLSIVLFFFNHSSRVTRLNWTPSHIIHIFNCIPQTEHFILLYKIFTKLHVLDVEIREQLLAVFIWTSQIPNLSTLNLTYNHVCHTFCAKEMLTRRQKCEFISQKTSHANIAIVFLVIKGALVGFSCCIINGLELSCSLIC